MGNPFVHVELNTTDVDLAKNFYSQLFDWELEDMAMGPSDTYTIIKVGDGTGGGLLKNPEPDCPSFLAGVCPGGRHRRRDPESKVAGRDDFQGLT
jgi:predicted enzyme related to lactoylglutathione lyase